jgi:hypothetical protein
VSISISQRLLLVPVTNALYAILYFSLRYLISFKNLLRSIENIGISMVYGINYFARGELHNPSYIHYVRHEAMGNDLLNSSLNYVPSLRKLYMDLTTRMADYGNIKRRLGCIYISDRYMKKRCIHLKSRLKMAAILKNKLLNGGHIERTGKLVSHEEMSNAVHVN